MDQKQFDQWMEWSEIANDQESMRQTIRDAPEETLREFLIKLRDLIGGLLNVGYYMGHREELADLLFELRRSSTDSN